MSDVELDGDDGTCGGVTNGDASGERSASAALSGSCMLVDATLRSALRRCERFKAAHSLTPRTRVTNGRGYGDNAAAARIEMLHSRRCMTLQRLGENATEREHKLCVFPQQRPYTWSSTRPSPHFSA